MPTSPFSNLPPSAFWKAAVAAVAPDALSDLWEPRHPMAPGHRIASLGSCFAQHLGGPLRRAGLDVIDTEPPPPGLAGPAAQRFGYGLFSARTGNIYTAAQLAQLMADARDDRVDPTLVWTRDGRFFDALRPGVEPDGLTSVAEVVAHRHHHLARLRRMFADLDTLVFTLGLVEGWRDAAGRAVPTAPGVIADPPEPATLTFHRAVVTEVMADLDRMVTVLADINPAARLLLTVSPVPLTATAGGDHVLVASGLAKATLRAAAEAIRQRHAHVDYFPSYDIIMNPAARGRWLAPNLRNVTPDGVAAVMRCFLAAQGLAEQDTRRQTDDLTDPHCDEALAEAFLG
jgi:hypothetical protein